MSHTRYLVFNNRLEKDIERIAFSFNFPLNLFFTSKYYIKCSRIYPSGLKYCVFAFCLLIVINALCVYRILTIYDTKVDKTQFKYDLFSPSFVINFISSLFAFWLMFILDIVHKDYNVLLILKIQAIYKSIGFRKSIRSFIIWSWISTTTTIIVHLVLSFMNYEPYISFEIGYIIDDIIDVMCISLDNNLVIAIRFIILLRKYLDAWIQEVFMMKDDMNDEQSLKLFKIYQSIMETYNLYKKIYQVMVLYHTFCTFQRALCYVNFVIYDMSNFAESAKGPFLLSLGLILFLAKDIALVIIQSKHCEKFYITVEEAETACIQLIKNRDYPKSQEHLCKKVIQYNQSFSKMTACGLFYVDATLPMYLMGVICHYVIIHLQFYFL